PTECVTLALALRSRESPGSGWEWPLKSSLCAFAHESAHNFLKCFLSAAEVTTEQVFVQMCTGLDVPETAGVRADLVSQYDGTVSGLTEFQLEVNQNDAQTQQVFFHHIVDFECICLDLLDLFG